MTPSEIVHNYRHNHAFEMKALTNAELWNFLKTPTRMIALDCVVEFPFATHRDYWEHADLLQPFIVDELRSRYDTE